ncbi:MAG: hypothetical protein WAM69_16750 [Candidatus Sulfotelmatobacter sp.]
MLQLPLFDKFAWRGYSCPRNARSGTRQSVGLWPRSPFILLALLTTLTPCAAGQRQGLGQRVAHAAPVRSAIPRFSLPTGNFTFAPGARRSAGFRRLSPYTSLPFPFFGDSFSPDDIYSTGYPIASQPPVILLQAASAMGVPMDYSNQPDDNREPPAPQPLMIELQNGRYVRVSGPAADGEALPLAPAPVIAASSPAADLPPVVLVFRDGRSEKVRDYAISGGILYARGNFYTDGYWNKKIELSTLNLAQTLQANKNHGVRFVLPSSPNEVITRP